MTVVLDCNIIVISLTSKSRYHRIFRALVEGKFNLLITNDIVLEYEEIVQRKYGQRTAQYFITLLRELSNVHLIQVYYSWELIKADLDDNKYVDCAIAGKAEYVITEDKHFNVLKKIPFPSVAVRNGYCGAS